LNETKFGNPDLQNHVLDLIRETKMPVSVDFVANKLNLGWGTARAILLNLSIQGLVHMQKTTKSLIFSLKEEDAKTVQVTKPWAIQRR
jgi:predicted ArsR family transcriptional regulator